MKIEDIKKIHLKQLKNECQKLYKMKFEWADEILIEKLVEKRYLQIIHEMGIQTRFRRIRRLAN